MSEQVGQEKRCFAVGCIPAYNEEAHIASVILEVQKYVDKVLVCDDGSKDHTAEIAERMGAVVLKHKNNMGKGGAMRTLFDAAMKLGAEIAVTIDGDGQHDPREIPKLLEPILSGEADIVNGSRVSKGTSMPFLRRFGNRVLTFFVARGSDIGIKDAQSGFRAYSKKAVQIVDFGEHGMGVDAQIIIAAHDKGLRMVEKEVGVKYLDDSSTYGPLRTGLDILFSIIVTLAQKSPLLYIGLPGVSILLAGTLFTLYLFHTFNETRTFNLLVALLSIGGITLGLILIVAAMIVYAIAYLNPSRMSGHYGANSEAITGTAL